MTNNVELHHELLGSASIYPFLRHNSSQRQQMALGMQGQTLVLLNGGEKNHTFSGADRHFKEHTWDIRFLENVEVVRTIEKFGKRAGAHSFEFNPSTLIIYREVETNTFGCLSLDKYLSKDQNFGYKYNPTDNIDRLRPREHFAKDTVLMASPNVDEDGDYNYGLEVMTGLASIPAVIEDGVRVTKQFCERIKTRGIKKAVISLGNKGFPLNIWGNSANYKFMPDIGESVKDDGILAFTRKYSEDLAVCEMTDAALRRPDYYFDNPIYIEPNARIIDVNVIKQNRNETIPETMLGQAYRYLDALHSYYKTILSEFYRLEKEYGNTLRLTPELHNLVTRAMGEIYEKNVKGTITKTHRNVPIDEWRIEVTYEYIITPTIGYKLTDQHGAKAIIVDIIDEEDTMVDDRGHKVELFYDDKSTIKRMNLGRLYEKYFKSASLHLQEDIKVALNIPLDKKIPAETMIALLESRDINKVKEQFNLYMKYLGIVAPRQRDTVKSLVDKYGDRFLIEELAYQLAGKLIRLNIPVDNQVNHLEAVEEIEKTFKPLYAPTTFRKKDGTLGKTKDPIRVSYLYMNLLEKTAAAWSAASSAKRNHFGIPTKMSNFDKHSDPIRKNPTRAVGEAEQRNYSAHMPYMGVADIIDRSINPKVHREVCKSIVDAEDPFDIEVNVDREVYPRGNGRIQSFVTHMLRADGQELYRENLDDSK